MRLLQLVIISLSLVAFLFFDISDSRIYTHVPDEKQPGRIKELELHRLELSGLDFILGNMPQELSRVSGPGSLPRYRNGATGCAIVLALLLVVPVFSKRLFSTAGVNFFLLAGFLVFFIFLDDFKNSYFEFAVSKHFSDAQTIDSHMTRTLKAICIGLELFVLANIVVLLRKKFSRKNNATIRQFNKSNSTIQQFKD